MYFYPYYHPFHGCCPSCGRCAHCGSGQYQQPYWVSTCGTGGNYGVATAGGIQQAYGNQVQQGAALGSMNTYANAQQANNLKNDGSTK